MDKVCDQQSEIRQQAIGLLARREHSTYELLRKLSSKGFDQDEVSEVLAQLQKEKLLSDERYAESYVRFRAQKGYGPCRIRQELQERRVETALITHYLDSGQDWFQRAIEVRQKRFGSEEPEDFKARAKQQRFLQYRGFSTEQIAVAMQQDELE